MRITRRGFLKGAATGIAATTLPVKWLGMRPAFAAANSANLTKWAQKIRGLSALPDPLNSNMPIPVLGGVPDPAFPNTTMYSVTIGEFQDQLHPDMGPTTLWGYWDSNNPVKRHLAGVVVASRGTASRMRFTNTLPSDHIIPVDTGLPGANQAQNRSATHLHGGFVPWVSDGGPMDWFAPNGVHGLSFLNGPGGMFDNAPTKMVPGQADYFYPNDQSMRLMWYHDHAHGITRINAYAGIATAYLLLDAVNGNYVGAGKIPPLTDAAGKAQTYPLVFQDKIFVTSSTLLTDPTWSLVVPARVQAPGSLWYNHIYDPVAYRKLNNRIYNTAPNPSVIPEFFGDTMLCNGTVYPYLTVEAKRYRFLMLDACNARFLNLNLYEADPANPDGINLDPSKTFPVNPPGPDMIQIGNEAGFLVNEVKWTSPKPFDPITAKGNLILAPAERADVIIDFTGLAGKEYILYNDSPGPFPGGMPGNDYYLNNPTNPIQPLPGTGPDTRQLLRIKVVATANPDPQPAVQILDPTKIDPPLLSPIPTTVAPVPPLALPVGAKVRNLTLNETFDKNGRLMQLLGTTTLSGTGFGREYLAPPTEVVPRGTVEVWRIFNLTADTHPIHFHLVNVQVLSRQPFKLLNGRFGLLAPQRGPELNELGWKETVQMNPGECTTVAMKFDLPTTPFTVPASPRTGGFEYVWHCHILEHEEHDMMRPLIVT